jgi:hypothetical protein
MIRTIFAQGTRAEAFARWGKVADALRERHGKLGAPMDAAREDVLAHMDDPKEHWARLAGTNPLERVSKEIKRRADVAGISPDGAAVVRLVGALMLEQPDEWAVNGPSAVATSAWKAPPGSPILIPWAARLGSLTKPRTEPRTGIPTPNLGTRPRISFRHADAPTPSPGYTLVSRARSSSQSRGYRCEEASDALRSCDAD